MPLSDRKRKEGDVTPGEWEEKDALIPEESMQGSLFLLWGGVLDMNVQEGHGKSPERQGELPLGWTGGCGPLGRCLILLIQHGPGVPLQLLQGGGWTDTSFLFLCGAGEGGKGSCRLGGQKGR